MPGPQDFINPIVQAMMGLHEGTMQRRQQELDKRKQTENERAAQVEEQQKREQLQQANDLAERHYALAKAGLDWQKELEAQHRHVEGMHFVQGQLDKGATLPEQEVGSPSIGTPTIGPGGMPLILPQAGATDRTGVPMGQVRNPLDPTSNLSRSMFAGPGQVVQQQANLAGGIAGAQRAALDPFLQAEAANAARVKAEEELKTKKSLNEQQNAAAIERQKNDLQNKLDRDAADNRSRELIHSLILQGKMQPQDADSVIAAYKGIVNGQTSLTALPKELKEAVTQYAGTRGTQLPTNQVNHSKKLDTLSGIDSLLQDYTDLATNYSRDSKNSSALATLTGSSAIPFTDLKSKTDALKANGGALASYFDQQNRKSDAEILRQFTGLFDPRSTTAQNLAKIEQHKKLLGKTIQGTFSGINPEDVSNVLEERGLQNLKGSVNGQAAEAPKYKDFAVDPKTKHRIGTNDGGNTWFDVQTGKKI